MIITLFILLIGLLTLFFSLYLMGFAISGLFYTPPPLPKTATRKRIAVVIPAYREDAVILDSATRALNQSYDFCDYEVFVVADGLKFGTVKLLANLPITVIPVTFETSTKVKALRAAIDKIDSQSFDAITILDADNVMEPDFLERANRALCSGHLAIQGRRMAKNSSNPLSRLDGLTEAINTHIFRKGHQAAGFPSALTGSGMTFDLALFASFLRTTEAVGGFDKELELSLTRNGISILYDEEAVILDEKVSHASHLTKQRSRWMGAQWHYARQSFPDALQRGFGKENLAYLDKAFQMVLPPRVLLLTAQVLMISLAYLVGSGVGLAVSLLSFLVCCLSMVTSIPAGQRITLIRDAFYLPVALTAYLAGISKSLTANRRFVHTPHQQIAP